MTNSSDSENNMYGPALVSVANSARALDAPVRRPLSNAATNAAGGLTFNDPSKYLDSAIAMARGSSFVALVEHFLGFIILLPIIFFKRGLSPLRASIKNFDTRDWISAIYISVGASALGLFFFLIALGYGVVGTSSGTVTVAILVQKSQPIITFIFAAAILHERPRKEFYIALGVSIIGILLLAWPQFESTLNSGELFEMIPFIASLLAAILWGGGTVFGRILTEKVDYWDLTFIRYTGGFIFLLFFNLVLFTYNPKFFDILTSQVTVFGTPENPGWGTPESILFFNIIWGGLVCIIYSTIFTGGILPLALYYYGLKRSKASIAGLAELAFPLLAIFVNYFFLNETLTELQLIGAGLLIITVSSLSYINAKDNSS